MSYKIPSELKYEEKVLFNLSIWQSLWLGLFGALAAGVFLKTAIPFEVKAMVCMVLAGLGIGFAFFNLKAHAASLLGFVSKQRTAGYFDRQMQNFMEVQEIQSETIFLRRGGAKAIVQVRPINFHILSESHRKAIILAYRDFLNSLDFPVQIAMRTIDLSMDEYFGRLERKARVAKSGEAYRHFCAFRDFTSEYIRMKGTKNRLFYIIIPAQAPFPAKAAAGSKLRERELDSLASRVKVCQEKLHNCNLFTRRLGDGELAALLGGYFDCFIEARQDYLAGLTSLKSCGTA